MWRRSRAGDEGRPVRRWALSGRDPDGRQRPVPGVVPPPGARRTARDDLQWYEAKKQAGGSYISSTPTATTRKNLVAHTTAYVEKIPGPEMKAALSAGGRYLDVTLTGRGDLTQVWFPTWSQDNGQDDLRWHEASRQADGSWTCRIALSGPLRHRRLLHPRLRQQQEESGGPPPLPYLRLPSLPSPNSPPAGPLRHAGGAVRRWAVPGCDPGGPQRPDEGLVPHLERRERPGRSALVRGHQAAGRLLDLPGASGQPQERGRLLPPRLRQQQEEPGGHTTASVSQVVSPQVWTRLPTAAAI